MTTTQFIAKIDTIIELAKKSSTGTPEQLAEHIAVSQRTLYRLINYIRTSGHQISYSRTRQTYIID